MSSNNSFFESGNHTLFGGRFGYALEYCLTKKFGAYHVRFAQKMIPAEDPHNDVMPRPIDLVSECIYRLTQEKNKGIMAHLYGRCVFIRKDSTLNDVKEQIQKIQKKNLVKISKKVSPAIK